MSILLVLLLLSPREKAQLTTPLEEYICTGKELASQSAPLLPAHFFEKLTDTIPWVFVDQLTFSEPLMNNTSFSLHNSDWSIEYSSTPETLSTLAQLALSYAPLGFHKELIAAFHRLDTLQDVYAQLILDTPAKCLDEVTYQICHIGQEILSYPEFEPNLLLVNADLLYEIDDSLQYADIVDYYGCSLMHFSTVRYRVVEDGDSIWFELPPEIYYEYIVHPIISDEFPDMSEYVYSKFWREYLFYESDSGYPILGEEIKNAKILWNREKQVLPPGRPFTPENGALDMIGNWATYTVPQAASGNRPIQPNIIAHEHNGNCGELQDVLTAGARACLVPCVCTMDPCEDHVWCEFYDEGFYPYQVDLGFGVTHIADTSVAYDEQVGGSKRVSAIFNWRSDGYWWTVTGTYSHVCSLFVYVYDLMGRPIDGASVTIASEGWYGGISTSTRAHTDPDGYCSFALGDLRNFYARVSTPIGSYPPAAGEVIQIIENSQSGAKYYKVFYIDNYLPTIFCSDTTSTDSLSLWKFEVVLDPLQAQSSGDCITRYGPGDSIRVYRSFYEEYAKGNIDLFFVDSANFEKYLLGEPFKAFEQVAASADTFAFIAQDSAQYHLIFSNEDVLYYTPFCNIKVNLYENSQVGIDELVQKKFLNQRLPTVHKERLLLYLNEPTQIKIYETSGRLVYDSKKKVQKIDRVLSAGIYFVRMVSDNQIQMSKCVIVK